MGLSKMAKFVFSGLCDKEMSVLDVILTYIVVNICLDQLKLSGSQFVAWSVKVRREEMGDGILNVA